MPWWQCALLGAGGGALVEVLSLFKWVTVWQAERRAGTGRLKARPPSWKKYVDIPAHAWLLLIRSPLGAAVALLFGLTGQISGAYAAVAFGFAAPAVLAQLGSLPVVAAAITPASTVDPARSEARPHEPARGLEVGPVEESGMG